MTELMFILLIIPLLGCLFALLSKKNEQNVFYVTMFTLASMIAAILRILPRVVNNLADVKENQTHFQLSGLDIELTFGADLFSMLLLLAVCLAMMIGTVGLNQVQRKNKALMFWGLFFMWNISGFLCARDMISFYTFFAAMTLPMLMLIGMFGNIKKSSTLYVYFASSLAGILLLLAAELIIYRFNGGNAGWIDVVLVTMPKNATLVVWIGVCAAFLSRIPIWPFHHWFSTICATVKNPLVYIVFSLTPLTGVYGFMRFWQFTVPQGMESLLPIITVFGVMTMLFAAFIGISYKEFLPKLFSYSAVYYLLFLLVIILPEGKYEKNIAYALFTFLIVNSSLAVLELWSEDACAKAQCDYRGVLAYMPRLAKVFGFFVLVAVGLPVSAMFWNDFVLISVLFGNNFALGIGVMTAITMISAGLLNEMFMMKNLRKTTEANVLVEDITRRQEAFFGMITVLLFLAFFDPLWFVF